MQTLGPQFNTERMLLDYYRDLYLPAARREHELYKDAYRMAREQARVLARSGVYLAMQQLNEDTRREALPSGEKVDWLEDRWGYFPSNDPKAPNAADPYLWVVPLANPTGSPVSYSGHVEVRVTDEERRLDLNHGNLATLAAMLEMTPEEAADPIFQDRQSTAPSSIKTSISRPAPSSVTTPRMIKNVSRFLRMALWSWPKEPRSNDPKSTNQRRT